MELAGSKAILKRSGGRMNQPEEERVQPESLGEVVDNQDEGSRGSLMQPLAISPIPSRMLKEE